jgi:hypothetical protein
VGSVTKPDELMTAIKAGASVGCRDAGGNTPLHLAAAKGNVVAVQMLLDHGAEHGAVNQEGWTALHAAAFQGYLGIVEALASAGAALATRTATEETALSLARAQGHDAVAAALDRIARDGPPAQVLHEVGAAAAARRAAEADHDGSFGATMPRLRRNYGARSAADARGDEDLKDEV